MRTSRKLVVLVTALFTLLFGTVVGAGTAQATCGSQSLAYNLTNSGLGGGVTSAVRFNGWIDNCTNYTVDLAVGQNTAEFTSPDYRFDPEWLYTSPCWNLKGAIYYQGDILYSTYTWSYANSRGDGWHKMGDAGWRYNIYGAHRSYAAGCVY